MPGNFSLSLYFLYKVYSYSQTYGTFSVTKDESPYLQRFLFPNKWKYIFCILQMKNKLLQDILSVKRHIRILNLWKQCLNVSRIRLRFRGLLPTQDCFCFLIFFNFPHFLDWPNASSLLPQHEWHDVPYFWKAQSEKVWILSFGYLNPPHLGSYQELCSQRTLGLYERNVI